MSNIAYSHLLVSRSAYVKFHQPQSRFRVFEAKPVKYIVDCDLSPNEGVLKVTGSHINFKSGSI